MNQMPQNRVLLYLFCFSLLPILFALWNYQIHVSTLDMLEERVQRMQLTYSNTARKQASNLLVRNYYKDADRFYLEKQVESMRLLEKETDALQKASSQKSMAEDPRISRRLAALNNNTIVFSEGMVQSYPFFNEIPDSLAHPVEVDVADIRDLLAKIDGRKIGEDEPGPNRPQLLITDFRLDRKSTPNESEVYNLNFRLIKREYL